jgi:hypothetical protein
MSDALPLDGAETSANPFQALELFAWQIYEEERQRDVALGWRCRPPMNDLNEIVAHIRERESRLQPLRDAALGAAHKIKVPALEVERRIKTLEDACKCVLFWTRNAPGLTWEELERKRLLGDTSDPAGAYLIEQCNLLGRAIEPVHRLTALYDGQNAAAESVKLLPSAGPGRPDAQSHADGPEGGCWIWWQNKRHDVPKGNVYKLLAFMWDRDSASYEALIGPVFDDDVVPQTTRSLANKAGKALKRIGVPWRFSTDSTTRYISRKPAS